MCGICGKINLYNKPVGKHQLNMMCQALSCRGPDDSGHYSNNSQGDENSPFFVGLGHQRLSIIDLSKAGHQPMSNENGTIWITFNGEIYNYQVIKKDLEAKGHTFISDTDTEVLVHLYEEEGLNAVNHINGMFAFALWDEGLNRLWVCRDRAGIKPLVYYWNEKQFIFGSEIKALLTDSQISKELDDEALFLYLTFNYVPAPHTIYKGIKKLEPGHWLVIQNGKLEIEKYWDTPYTTEAGISSLSFNEQERNFKKRLFESLNDAVSDRMIADVPLGAFLSGGIDSSIIVALMARHSSKPIKTFSIGFKNDGLFDETHYAREVAKLYGTDHHEFQLTSKDMLDVLPDVLSTFDEPFADSSAIPTYIVSKETRDYVTVALSGDGGDELFAGYRSYIGEYWYSRYMSIPKIIRKSFFEKLIKSLPDSRDSRTLEYVRRIKKFIKSTQGSFPERMLALREIFPENIRKELLLNVCSNNGQSGKDPALMRIRDLLQSHRSDRINGMLYLDFKDSLPGDMLTKVDWMSMKNSLEVRVPFLDHRVVELAFQMPGSLKLHKGRTKHILKETFREILPPSLYRRPKAGFEIPISRWLKTDLKFLVDKYLCEKKVREQGIFDYMIVKHLIEDHLSKKTDTSWMLWNLIIFQYWFENHFL